MRRGSMTDLLGQQLGKYRLVQLLGRGGFAEVYLGRNVHLGTLAAVKVHVDQVDVEVFKREAQTLEKLKHMHIVRMLEFGIDDQKGIPFLVMDYAAGGSLRTRHPKGSRLSLSTIVSYIKPVAQALQYAHEHKFIHRDIKPENILIGENEAILLSDFGIALIAQSSISGSGKGIAGTLVY